MFIYFKMYDMIFVSFYLFNGIFSSEHKNILDKQWKYKVFAIIFMWIKNVLSVIIILCDQMARSVDSMNTVCKFVFYGKSSIFTANELKKKVSVKEY